MYKGMAETEGECIAPEGPPNLSPHRFLGPPQARETAEIAGW